MPRKRAGMEKEFFIYNLTNLSTAPSNVSFFLEKQKRKTLSSFPF
jgi:hypothetical protein